MGEGIPLMLWGCIKRHLRFWASTKFVVNEGIRTDVLMSSCF